MTSQLIDNQIKDAAAELVDTPYALLYISAPTPSTTRYVFQHGVAVGPAEAMNLIAVGKEHLKDGTAQWSSGEPFTPADQG